MSDTPEKFSFNKLLIKLSSRKFAVWVTSTLFVREVLTLQPDTPVAIAIIIAWAIFGCSYLFGNLLVKSISNAISNAKIDVGIGK